MIISILNNVLRDHELPIASIIWCVTQRSVELRQLISLTYRNSHNRILFVLFQEFHNLTCWTSAKLRGNLDTTVVNAYFWVTSGIFFFTWAEMRFVSWSQISFDFITSKVITSNKQLICEIGILKIYIEVKVQFWK